MDSATIVQHAATAPLSPGTASLVDRFFMNRSFTVYRTAAASGSGYAGNASPTMTMSDDWSADNVQERQPTARRRATSGTRTNQAPDRRPKKGLPTFDLTMVTTFDDATGKGA